MPAEDEEIPQEQESGSGPATSIFDGLMPQNNPIGKINISDVTNNSQYFNPQQQAIYEQYQQQQLNNSNPSTGALEMQDYYPGFSNGGAVGTSSGSIIGTQSLFGGGGALVPIGMMDARDAALTRASLQKQKEVEDFRKQFHAPTSKLTNINEGLTDEYYKFHQDSWDKALKKANGDPNLATRLLKNDPSFWAKDKSYQDLAKRGDAVVGKIAEIETRHKSGDVFSPALIEAKNKVLMDMNPNSPEFKHLSNSIMRMDADREFSDAANEALMRVVTTKTGQVFDRSNPDSVRIYKKTIEELSPETKQAVIENLKKIYDGSSMYSPEYIERNAGGMMNYKKTDEDLHVSQKRENADKYEDGSIVAQSAEKNTTRGESVNSYTEHYVPTNAIDQKKELNFAVSDDMTSAGGEAVNNGESGYVKGYVQGIGVKPYYKKEKRFLNDEEVKVLKDRGVYETTKDIEMKPAVIFNVTPTKENPDEQKTIYFDTKKIAGVFKSSGDSKKDYESMREKTEKYAEEKNKNRSAKPAEEKNNETIQYTIKGKKWAHSKVKEAADASGMTIEEYLKELNDQK